MRISKAKQIKALELQVHELQQAVQVERQNTWRERNQAIYAKNGLIPYVKHLQELDLWLRQRPELREQLEPILRKLELWEIRLAVSEISLTVASPERT